MICNRTTQSGQTLIETLVAIFILVTGIFGIMALASNSYSFTGDITHRIVGTGLAREGVEAIKNMRDTNWQRDPGGLVSGCYTFSSSRCYENWLDINANVNGGYNLDIASYPLTTASVCGDQSFTLRSKLLYLRHNPNFIADPNSAGANTRFFWTKNGSSLDNYANGVGQIPLDAYRLYFSRNVEGSSPQEMAYYFSWKLNQPPDNFGGSPTSYFRALCIKKIDNVAPFSLPTNTNSPLLLVTSRVWWQDNVRCKIGNMANYFYDQAPASCKIQLQMYLTNWKTN